MQPMNETEPPDLRKEQKPLPDSMRTREPWPMWTIGVAIAVFIALYTYINIEYRKPEKPYEPYQALKDKQNAPVLKNFYDWYALKPTKLSDASEIETALAISTEIVSDAVESEFPEQMKYFMLTKPVLVPREIDIRTPTSVTPGAPLQIQLKLPGTLADDDRYQLLAYYKDGDLYLLSSLFVEDVSEARDALSGPGQSVHYEIPTDPIETPIIKVHHLTQNHHARWQIVNDAPVESEAAN